MPLTPMSPFASSTLVEQVTSTLKETLALRGESPDTLVMDHEGLTLGGSVDRYIYSMEHGSLTIDFSQLAENRCGVDRIVIESRPDVMQDAQFASNLSASLELYADNAHMGWSMHDDAEAVITLERLMDLLHVLSRTHQQMQDTAQFIQCMAIAEPEALSA